MRSQNEVETVRVSSKNSLYLHQDVYFLEKYDGLFESIAFSQNWSILKTRMDQRVT